MPAPCPPSLGGRASSWPAWVFHSFLPFSALPSKPKCSLGPKGILPLDDFMNRLARNRGAGAFTFGFDAFWAHIKTWPTLTWFSADLSFLVALTTTGMVFSLLLALGFMPGLLCLALGFSI